MQYSKAELAKQCLFIIVLAVSWLVAGPAFSATKTPLPADKAFVLTVSVEQSNLLNIKWHIAPQYYLYRQRMHFTFDPKLIADIRLPQGEVKQDPKHGQYEVYSGDVNIPVALQTSAKTIQLTVDYQGCSLEGFCYPPSQKTLTLDLSGQSGMAGGAAQTLQPPQSSFQSLLTDQNGVRTLLASKQMGVMLLIFAGLGLLLAFTPCVLPMIPILTSIIVGHKQPVSTGKAFMLSVSYVMGSSITYAFAGMAAALMGGSLQAWMQQPLIIILVSALFVLLAFSLFGFYDLRLPRELQNRITSVSRKQEGGTYVGVFIMGMVSTLIVSPCVTAPLVGVLMYIAETGNMALGGGALFAMGLGMGIPLVVIGVTAGKWLPRRGPWMYAVQRFFGLLMIGMAVWLLSRVSSPAVILKFISVMLLAAAVYLGVYLPRFEGSKRMKRGFGLASGIAGVLLFTVVSLPAVMTHLSPARQSTLATNSFTIVHDLADLNQQLAKAQAAHRPVLLDFYADWCESCVVMDKTVFSEPGVMKNLSRFILLRADLSANNAADEAMLKNYDVIAPPTVLFFNNQGQEVNSHRIVGELTANEFMTRINTFITASCDKNVAC
ncbi:protein-disulfide reductase DsbD [Aquicella siphonis]|nr:protein-disulfide reductase DsbD [Aquicella siphonis]